MGRKAKVKVIVYPKKIMYPVKKYNDPEKVFSLLGMGLEAASRINPGAELEW